MELPVAVACKEVFDENSQPSAEEISEYAKTLGIDPESERHLLPLAEEGLMQALPPPWKVFYDEKISSHYYYNEETKATQWEHPLDNIYRELVSKARDLSTHDDTCASVQELPTFEEVTKHVPNVENKIDSEDEDLSTDTEHQSDVKDSFTNTQIIGRAGRLAPLGRPPMAPITSIPKVTDKKLVESKISGKWGIEKPISLRQELSGDASEYKASSLFEKSRMKDQHNMIDLKMPILDVPENEDFRLLSTVETEGLPLTGKGEMLFKIKSHPNSDTEKTSVNDYSAKNDNLKGILREKVLDNTVMKKQEVMSLGSPKTSYNDEDKKSVRFNLENPLFDPTTSTSSNSSSDVCDGQSSIISAPPTSDLNKMPSPPLSPLAPFNVPQLFNESVGAISNVILLKPLKNVHALEEKFSEQKLIKNIQPNEDKDPDEEDRDEVPATSSKRRLMRPPAAVYIKPNLFQKDFTKISDIVKLNDGENKKELKFDSVPAEKEFRPRSPLLPPQNVISINLMESIDSEASIESPDKEFANLDLNDMDNTDNFGREEDSNSISSKLGKSLEKANEYKSSKNNLIENSPNDLKYNNLLTYTPTHICPDKVGETMKHVHSSQSNNILKTSIRRSSDSTSSMVLGSPKLDGLVISQGKSFNRDPNNIVVMYQFNQSQKDNSVENNGLSPQTPDPSHEIEKVKTEEKIRLERNLQEELEKIKTDWLIRERNMRRKLEEEIKENEEKFAEERNIRLLEQAEHHKKLLKQIIAEADNEYELKLESARSEQEDQYRRNTEMLERNFQEILEKLKEENAIKLENTAKMLEADHERTLAELREKYQSDFSAERSRILEDSNNVLETLREEQSARIAELRHDYRAEVERLRTQHACHLQEIRGRLASERTAATRRGVPEVAALADKYRCLKEKYARLKHDVKMSIERRNKRREISMTTGSETEKSNSHKVTQERCRELNEAIVNVVVEPEPSVRNVPTVKYNDAETSQSECNVTKLSENNNEEWTSPSKQEMEVGSGGRTRRAAAVAFREPPRARFDREPATTTLHSDIGATTDCQDSSDATTADDKMKSHNGYGRRRCFTRLKSASTSRLNYSPKRGEGWSSPLEALRQQLRKLDDLEEQFPDLACQPAYSLRYPFADLGTVAAADTPELEFVRHRALVEREGMRRARAVLRRRRAALREARASPPAHAAAAVSDERETTELEVALHRARALLGEKEIRLRHIERCLRRLAEVPPPPLPPPTIVQEGTSDASSGSEAEGGGEAVANHAVLRSLRALHADVRDIWLALDARRPVTASPDTSSCQAPNSSSQPRQMSLSPQPSLNQAQSESSGGVIERARNLRAWLQSAP